MAELQGELEKIIKQAQKQPGIKELMDVYGQYEEVLVQCQTYLSENLPKPITFNSNHTLSC